ncbi:MAG: peptidoglycan-binding domain-containing protein [Solirubrobacteraceae bacterium]
MGAVLALTVVVGVVAFLVGRGVSTPAQQAARARAPAASLLTAPVLRTHARTTVVLRGTLTDGGAISVGVPGDLSGDLAVVTAVATVSGANVVDGSLIAAVAGRPVFVLQGHIPAYSTMSYGSSGIEVSELQAGLEAAGFSTGTDTAGTYGAGTAAAVAELYQRAGYAPVTAAGPAPPASGAHGKHKARPPQYATVPLGEVMFTPRLPVDVVSVAHLGQTIASGKPLATLGSGRLSFVAETDANTARLLRVGATGRATSDLSHGSFAIRLRAKRPGRGPGGGPGSKLTLSPVHPAAAARYVGQNMALHIHTGQAGGVQWVVPVSAVITNAAGASSVTVLHGSREVSVSVHAGLAYAGREVVRPTAGGLKAGEDVVTGLGGSP